MRTYEIIYILNLFLFFMVLSIALFFFLWRRKKSATTSSCLFIFFFFHFLLPFFSFFFFSLDGRGPLAHTKKKAKKKEKKRSIILQIVLVHGRKKKNMRVFVFVSNIPAFLLEPLTEEEQRAALSQQSSRKASRDPTYERLHRLLAAHTSGLMLTMHVGSSFCTPMSSRVSSRGSTTALPPPLPPSLEEKAKGVHGPGHSFSALPPLGEVPVKDARLPSAAEEEGRSHRSGSSSLANSLASSVEKGYGLALFASEEEALAACKAVIYPDGKGPPEDDEASQQRSGVPPLASSPASISSSASLYPPLRLRILQKEKPPAPEEVYQPTLLIEGTSVEKSTLAVTRGLERAYRGLVTPKWCPQTIAGKDCIFGTSCHHVHLAEVQKTVRKRPFLGPLMTAFTDRHGTSTVESTLPVDQAGASRERTGKVGEEGPERHTTNRTTDLEGDPLSARQKGDDGSHDGGGGIRARRSRVEIHATHQKDAHNDEEDEDGEWYIRMSREETAMLSHLLDQSITATSIAATAGEKEEGKQTHAAPLPTTTTTTTVVYDTLVPPSLRLPHVLLEWSTMLERRGRQQEAAQRKRSLAHPLTTTPQKMENEEEGRANDAVAPLLLPSPIAVPLTAEEVEDWLVRRGPPHHALPSKKEEDIEARVAARIQSALPPPSSSSPVLFFARLSCAGGSPWDWSLHDEREGRPLLTQLCPFPPRGLPTPLERDVLEQKVWFWMNQLNAFTTGEGACRALRCSPRVRDAVRRHPRWSPLSTREANEDAETTEKADVQQERRKNLPAWCIQLVPWLYLPTVMSEGTFFLEVSPPTDEDSTHKQKEKEEEEEMERLPRRNPNTETTTTSSRSQCFGLVQRHGELRVMTTETILREAIVRAAVRQRNRLGKTLPRGVVAPHHAEERRTPTTTMIDVPPPSSPPHDALSNGFVSELNAALDRVVFPYRGADPIAEQHVEDVLQRDSLTFSFAVESMRRHLQHLHSLQYQHARNPTEPHDDGIQRGFYHRRLPHRHADPQVSSASSSPSVTLPRTTAVAVNMALYTPPLLSPLFLLRGAREGLARRTSPPVSARHRVENIEDLPLTGEERHPSGTAIPLSDRTILRSILHRASLYATVAPGNAPLKEKIQTGHHRDPSVTRSTGGDAKDATPRTEANEKEIQKEEAEEEEEEALSQGVKAPPTGMPLVMSFHTYGRGVSNSYWSHRLANEWKNHREETTGDAASSTLVPPMKWNTTRHAYEPLLSMTELKRLRT